MQRHGSLLDMRNQVLKSYKLLTNELNLVFEDYDVDIRNIFYDALFISCDFDHSSKSTGTTHIFITFSQPAQFH
jgi:hypothetical protein